MIHAPGIYFGMPEAEYHADESFSASGVKNLLVSQLTYWTRSNMNPNRRDEETPAMAFGKACDKLIVEGPEAFREAYAVRPSPEDHPEALDGAEDLRARCAELGLKKGGTIAQLCDRILEADPAAQLFPRILREWGRDNAGKAAISAEWHRDIVNRAQVVRNHATVRKAFSGGYPQVSIFWIAANGVPMKARIDYLKIMALLDLKTFSNPMDKPIDTAVAHAMAYQRHPIQAVVYLDGIERTKAALRKQTATIGGRVNEVWLVDLMNAAPHRFGFIFVESGDVPNLRARWFDRRTPSGQTTAAFAAAQAQYEYALDAFARCQAKFGREPWIEDDEMRAFDDAEFPMWSVEAA